MTVQSVKFPETCYIENGNIILSEDKLECIVTIDGNDYVLDTLLSKGGNSFIIGLKYTEDYDEYSEICLIMKVCKFNDNKKAKKRFKQEITILEELNNKKGSPVITIFHSGKVQINIHRDTNLSPVEYLYYTMEYAISDLTKHIEESDFNDSGKAMMAYNIIQAFRRFHELGYYHRDIKSDNILLTDKSTIKIGDLGLAVDRNYFYSLDKKGEKIGPYGWLSPEAVNKAIVENTTYYSEYDCMIDHKSDIFQLGKLLWFVFNRNLPIGIIKFDDFLCGYVEVFNIIEKMLSHKKDSRPNLPEVSKTLYQFYQQTIT